jgi:hypothetical protein
LIELGDAIDQLGHVRAETGRQLILWRRCVFDDVVQDRRDDRVGVQVEVSENRRGGHGVSDIGLTREAFLAFVR